MAEPEFFQLDFEGTAETHPPESYAAPIATSRYVASNELSSSAGVGLPQPVRSRAPRLIAEDPEKRRIVGRAATTSTSNAAEAASAADLGRACPTAEQSPAPAPPAPPVFEGSGLAEAGTLRRRPQAAEEEDDEFEYAFQGGQREGGFHKQVFRPQAMPAHLVSNVKQRLNTEVLAEGEEEEEEGEEEEEEEEEEEGSDGTEEEDKEEAEEEEEEEDDKQRSRSRDAADVKQLNSWTTFAVSEGNMDTLGDEAAAAAAAAAGGSGSVVGSLSALRSGPAGAAEQPAEDLPSYKLMQALHVASHTGSGRASTAATSGGPSCGQVLLDSHTSPSPSENSPALAHLLPPSLLMPAARQQSPLQPTQHSPPGAAAAAAAASKAEPPALSPPPLSHASCKDAAASPSQSPPPAAALLPTASSSNAAAATAAVGGDSSPVSPCGAEVGVAEPGHTQQQLPQPDRHRAAAAAAAEAPSPGASAGQADTAGAVAAGKRGGDAAAGAAAAAAAAELEDEWEAANRARQRELDEMARPRLSSGGSATPRATAGTLLTYPEAMMHFMAMDTSATRGSVLASLPPPPGFFARLLCLGPPDLKPPLLREQLLQLLSLARLPFDNDDVMHVRLLGSLYAAFTGKSPDQPRYGSHWADLGFQGQDPATDLRGGGLLGLLQLLYLPQWSGEAAAKLYALSRHPVQEFPLAVVAINVTKWTLQALRSGSLSRAANSRGSAVEAAQHFYAGALATFYTTWLAGGKTMADSGHVLKEVESLALRRPGSMLEAARRPGDLPPPPAV